MSTQGNKERGVLTLLWRIERISLLMDSRIPGTRISSPSFTSRSLREIPVVMFLRPKDAGERGDPCLELECNLKISYEWSIVGSDGSDLAGGAMRYHEVRSVCCMLPQCPPLVELFATRRSEFFPNDTLTVRCRIRTLREEELQNSEYISGTTRCGGMKESFVWPITKFSHLGLDSQVHNTLTLTVSNDVLICMIILSLDGDRVGVKFGSLNNRATTDVFVKLSILGRGRVRMKTAEGTASFRQNRICVTFPDFASRAEILSNQSDWLSDEDVLTLFCEFFTFNTFTSTIDSKYFGYTNFPADSLKDLEFVDKNKVNSVDPIGPSLQGNDSLAEDLLRVYVDKTMTDFEIRSDGVIFPVHKMVLTARSPVFSAMFSSGMVETGSNFLYIPDVDSQTLKRMLNFMYGSAIEGLEWSECVQLYYAADKYQVESLKRQCRSFFRSNITVTNACEVLRLAYWHQDDVLKSVAQDFVRGNFDETVSTPEWAKFVDKEGDQAGKAMYEIYMGKLKCPRKRKLSM